MHRFDRRFALPGILFLVLVALALVPGFASAANRTVIAELWSADG